MIKQYRFSREYGFPNNYKEEIQKFTALVNSSPIKLSEHVKDDEHKKRYSDLGLNPKKLLGGVVYHNYKFDADLAFEYYYNFDFNSGTGKVTKVCYPFVKNTTIVFVDNYGEITLVTIMKPYDKNRPPDSRLFNSPDEINNYLSRKSVAFIQKRLGILLGIDF